MAKKPDKCSICGSTKSTDYWDYDTGATLCNKCYEKLQSKKPEETKIKERMNKKQKEKLMEIIVEGKWNYVAKYGLSWGALMFFFFILWDKFIMEYEIDIFDILINFIIWGAAGLIIGLWGWKRINKKVREK